METKSPSSQAGDPGEDPVAPAGGGDQDVAFDLIELIQKIEKLPGAISADPRAELSAADDPGMKFMDWGIPQHIEEDRFSGFSGGGAYLSRFRTIVGADEVRMADIGISALPAHGIREDGEDFGGDLDPLRPFGAQPRQAPFGGQMDRQGRDDPVRA